MSTLTRKKKPVSMRQVATKVWKPSSQPQPRQAQKSDVNFAFESKVYEWDGFYGEVAPAIPQMEIELFGPPERRLPPHGDKFDWDQSVEILQAKDDTLKIHPIKSFETAGLHPVMLQNIKLMGYTKPTPIQKCVIPAIYHNRDVLALTQTGSGKTAAFLIPIINQLLGKVSLLAAKRPSLNDPRSVVAEPLVAIIVPTRELAIQIFDEARKFCYRTNIRPAVVYGGADMTAQTRYLGRGCELLIATPGRIGAFLREGKALSLTRLRYLVIDEVDELITSSFREDIDLILQCSQNMCYGRTRRLLFSATLPNHVQHAAMGLLSFDHLRFHVGQTGSAVQSIQQNVYYVDVNKKHIALLELMRTMPAVRTIIFTNTTSRTETVAKILRKVGVPCVSVHSQRSQAERELAFRAFRKGESPVLITTSLAGRGVDVKNVGHVINYDLPRNQECDIQEYVHRIGRTGRIGHDGVASSLFCAGDKNIGSDLANLLLETNQHVPDFLQGYLPHKVSLSGVLLSQTPGQIVSIASFATGQSDAQSSQVSSQTMTECVKEDVKDDIPLIDFDS
ncbi:hypothetical protein TD95_004669 [Thielaviopsis punctulata]|uniref:RNA helicase n=1 Tax=Thielaviopsis punctulata TaxID=72032 RepID=A0A0F4ZEK2_9PEZI|nr:hypothetical protein TD95_004669 [Thielaviopsis punctulata]